MKTDLKRGKMRILIVDDSKLLRDRLIDSFMGY